MLHKLHEGDILSEPQEAFYQSHAVALGNINVD